MLRGKRLRVQEIYAALTGYYNDARAHEVNIVKFRERGRDIPEIIITASPEALVAMAIAVDMLIDDDKPKTYREIMLLDKDHMPYILRLLKRPN